ncbi:MAG: NYN domain-containing protein [Bacteroidia bacterium]|nr:NYN domain-containing protein [Bacteroidia bacterium]
MTQAEKKIALLIDGDNAQSKFIEGLLAEAGKYGKITIKRVYGDWTDNRLSGWKEQINKHSIRPMQKFAFAKGKNATDTAMIIDAMDILHSKTVSGFCIASSDSDYTGLAQRIKEEGIFVMGIGEAKKTTDAFVNACDIFIYTENLVSQGENEDNQVKNAVKVNTKVELPQSKITKKALDLQQLMNAFQMAVDDSGLAYMGVVGTALRKLDPSFDPRTYGFATMTSLFKSLSQFFELEYKDNNTSAYIKLKNQK